MYRYLLVLSLGSAGALAAQKSSDQNSSCELIKQNVTDLLGMRPVSAPQTTQRNLSLAVNLNGIVENCDPVDARVFVSKKLLQKKFLGDEGIKCKKLSHSIEGLLKDPRPTSSPQVSQFLSEAMLQLKIFEQYCGKSSFDVYNLSLCYSGGACG